MPTLDWIGKSAVVNHHRKVPYHLLRCDRELSAGDADAGVGVDGDAGVGVDGGVSGGPGGGASGERAEPGAHSRTP